MHTIIAVYLFLVCGTSYTGYGVRALAHVALRGISSICLLALLLANGITGDAVGGVLALLLLSLLVVRPSLVREVYGMECRRVPIALGIPAHGVSSLLSVVRVLRGTAKGMYHTSS